MANDRFYIDDVPVARDMSEWPPEIHLNEDGTPKHKPKKQIDPRYLTGPIIKRMRTHRGLTGRELAEKIGRSAPFVRTVENEYSSCRYETLAMIARACGYKIIIVTEEKWREYEQAYHTRQTHKRSGAR